MSRLERQIEARETQFGAYFRPLALAMDEATVFALPSIHGIEEPEKRTKVYDQFTNHDTIVQEGHRGLLFFSENEFAAQNDGQPIDRALDKLLDSHHFFARHMTDLMHDFATAHIALNVQCGRFPENVKGDLRAVMQSSLSDCFSTAVRPENAQRVYVSYLIHFYAGNISEVVEHGYLDAKRQIPEVLTDLTHYPKDKALRLAGQVVAERIALDTHVLKY